MKESELWLEVAQAWALPNPFHTGMCRTLDSIAGSSDVANRAGVRCRRYMGDNWGYIYPSGEEPLARSLAALWMALEAAEDEALWMAT